MSEQRGARWLAREQREIGAAHGNDMPSSGQHHAPAGAPPRYHDWVGYPMAERLSAASLAALAEVMGELGMVHDL